MPSENTGAVPPDDSLQFERAEPIAQAAAETPCAGCGESTAHTYYLVNGLVACPSCTDRIRRTPVEEPTASDLGRAAVYGLGAALLGTAVYFAVLALSGYEIGWIAVAVGWLVGKAVRRGGRGVGGWKLQLMAVGLTYLSIVGSYVPMVFRSAMGTSQAQSANEQAGKGTAPVVIEAGRELSVAKMALILLVVLALSAAVPFLQGLSSILGLFIIAIGLFEAWRLNKRPPRAIEGPFHAAHADFAV